MVARAWDEGRTMTPRDTRELSGVMEVFYTLIVVVVTRLYTFVKVRRTVQLKMDDVYCV